MIHFPLYYKRLDPDSTQDPNCKFIEHCHHNSHRVYSNAAKNIIANLEFEKSIIWSSQHDKTIFCDIDGTLLKHHGDGCLYKAMKNPPELLPNVIETIDRWKYNEYRVILTTGRPESMRKELKNN